MYDLESPSSQATGPERLTTRLRILVVPALFTATAFVGAALLFTVQPLIARMILPSYGGSATVWSTSSLFFQVLLLAAYGYAHWTTTRWGPRWQPRLHLVALALPLLALPIAVPTNSIPPSSASPVLWLLQTLALTIGLPFAVVATTGPLLQRWYSWTGLPRSHDPYFLFAAGNLGSFGGLLAYPFLIEPQLTLELQRSWWSLGFGLFLVLTVLCAVSVRVRDTPGPISSTAPARRSRIERRQVVRWVGLAFLPSSMMLGVTAHISTDVAAIPLLWVIPLAIYLATFVVAFARTTRASPVTATRAAVAATFGVVVTSLAPGRIPVGILVVFTMTMLALVAFAAHARLAAERPDPEKLTAFYLIVASGGALGGVLNGLVAPIAFDRVLEYPIALTLTPLLLWGLREERTLLLRHLNANRVRAVLVVLAIVLVPLTLRVLLWAGPRNVAFVTGLLLLGVVVGWVLTQAPRVLVLGLVLVYVFSALGQGRIVIDQSRTFFGSYTVRTLDGAHELVHGTTVHGAQFVDPQRRTVATSYYTAAGPFGDLMDVADGASSAIIGLGVGTIAAYGQPGEKLTFFEIDPEIVRIAEDTSLFSYLSDSEAEVSTVVGDGRLRIGEAPAGSFDLIILDAFSSDAVPVHLLTEEAMRTYADRLSADGLLITHISNRVFDLEPVVAAAADTLGWGVAVGQGAPGPGGAVASRWVALSPDADKIEDLLGRSGWSGPTGRQVRWTDDYSSVLSVLQ
ncbi:MAG: fused MFS/spermidine synthase [Nocardioides sp.]